MNFDLDKVIIAKSNDSAKAISAAKDKYIKEMCEKLNDPLRLRKTYWKILNGLLSNKKVPAIPPVLVNGEIISNFSEKSKKYKKHL